MHFNANILLLWFYFTKIEMEFTWEHAWVVCKMFTTRGLYSKSELSHSPDPHFLILFIFFFLMCPVLILPQEKASQLQKPQVLSLGQLLYRVPSQGQMAVIVLALLNLGKK